MSFIDSHCHLASKEFADDLAAVIQRARDAGVRGALVILAAEDDSEFDRAELVSAAWEDVRFSIGVTPHVSSTFSDTPAAAAGLTDNRLDLVPAARAVGEIGLDYHYDQPRDVQQDVFREQIRLARRRQLPIVIHTRDAEDDTFRILEEESASEVGGVFHCFTGDRAMARRALDIGFHISLSGIVSFPRATELHEVAKLVPLDRLLIETDSPYLAPVPFRGKRNEPAFVTRVAEVVAELRRVEPIAIGEAARVNFERLFKP
jgi:TatD DNase family protein